MGDRRFTDNREGGRSAMRGMSATATSDLDDALDRVSALDFEIPNPFVNHGPMACEALVELGFDSALDDWVRAFESLMGEAVAPLTPDWPARFDWEDRLGDHRELPHWMGYFERVLSEDGWPSVVETWVPRLMPGLSAALFHGVIRTSHAVRAIRTVDTPSRRSELARALGNWAVWFGPGRSLNDDDDRPSEPQTAAVGAAGMGAHYYVSQPTIFNLHGVTGAMAVHLLASHIPESAGAAAVAQLHAEHRALYAGVELMEGEIESPDWGTLASTAASSHDAHQIKLVEACRRGFRATGDTGFVAAAQTVACGAPR